jgi:hypothetical protein
MEGLRIHDLRHTVVALWTPAGANPKEVAARAGRSSVSFTLDRHGHPTVANAPSASPRDAPCSARWMLAGAAQVPRAWRPGRRADRAGAVPYRVAGDRELPLAAMRPASDVTTMREERRPM